MPTNTGTGDTLNFSVDRSSQRVLQIQCNNPNGSTQDLTGITVECSVEGTDFAQVVKILSTDVLNPAGSVAIPTPSDGTITLTLSPTATEAIYDSRGGYCFWALWANPGTGSAYPIVAGQITPNRVAKP